MYKRKVTIYSLSNLSIQSVHDEWWVLCLYFSLLCDICCSRGEQEMNLKWIHIQFGKGMFEKSHLHLHPHLLGLQIQSNKILQWHIRCGLHDGFNVLKIKKNYNIWIQRGGRWRMKMKEDETIIQFKARIQDQTNKAIVLENLSLKWS